LFLAKAQRGVVAALREIIKKLAGCNTELNKEQTVQECDATMMLRKTTAGYMKSKKSKVKTKKLVLEILAFYFLSFYLIRNRKSN
jgi:hypothetical protein